MINFDLLWTWKQLKISFLVVLLYMWAWIGEFLLLYLIWYYICYEFTPYMALRIWHFCRWKTKVYYFCRKIIRYGISVAKISTYALPGQTLEEITNIFHQFNAWKLSQYYRDILHHFELSWNYRDNRKKHYRSGVVGTTARKVSGICPQVQYQVYSWVLLTWAWVICRASVYTSSRVSWGLQCLCASESRGCNGKYF